MYVYIYIYIYICVCVCVFVILLVLEHNVYVYVYTYICINIPVCRKAESHDSGLERESATSNPEMCRVVRADGLFHPKPYKPYLPMLFPH